MCFKESTFCCCGMPLWAGALLIGLSENFYTWFYAYYIMPGAALGCMQMNFWFGLLFVPSLFYSADYRKTVFVIYSVTTILTVMSALIFTLMVLGNPKHLPVTNE